MFGAFIAVFIVASVAMASGASNEQLAPNGSEARVVAYANNMRVYHQQVVRYATANPAATGTVSDSLLALPAWYQNLGWTHNITAAGVVQTYKRASSNMTAEADHIMAAMPELSQGSISYGTVASSSGGYHSPVLLIRRNSEGVRISDQAGGQTYAFNTTSDTVMSSGLPAGTIFYATKVR
jgi:hypothetical protein